MNKMIFMLAGLLLVGCAAEQPAMPVRNATTGPITGGAAALCFDVPITQTEPELEISRADRGMAAFAGYQDASVSTYDIVSFDHQGSDRANWYDRESITEEVGTSRR